MAGGGAEEGKKGKGKSRGFIVLLILLLAQIFLLGRNSSTWRKLRARKIVKHPFSSFWPSAIANRSSCKAGSSWMLLRVCMKIQTQPLQSWESMDLAPLKRRRMNRVKGNQGMKTAAARFPMQSKTYLPVNCVRYQSNVSCLHVKASDVCSFLCVTLCTGYEEEHRLYFKT